MRYTKVEGIEHDFLGAVITDDKIRGKTFDKYRDAMTSDTVINIKFEAIDSMRNEVYVEDNGVRISVDLNSLGLNPESRYLGRTALTRITYSVKVDKIDDLSMSVHCVVVNLKEAAKLSYMAAIEDALRTKKDFCCKAKVTRVDIVGRRVLIDIAGVGLLGVIEIGDWSKTFISSFTNIVSVNDVIPVVITGKTYAMRMRAYRCSRKLAIAEDSWAGIEKRYPVGSIVTLRCIKCREKSFFANISGLRDIEVFCEYPAKDTDAQGNLLVIHEGEMYQGIIYKVSEEKKTLKARVLYKIKER